MSNLYDKPSQEQVDEAIEKLADLIARKYRMTGPAVMMLMGLKPVAPVVRQQMFFSLFPYIPFFELLPGIDDSAAPTMKYLEILDNDQNIERLIRRIEEISKEISEEKNREKTAEKGTTLPSRLKSLFRRSSKTS